MQLINNEMRQKQVHLVKMRLVDSRPRRCLDCMPLEHRRVCLHWCVNRMSLVHCRVRLDRDVDRVALAWSRRVRLDRDVDRVALAWSLMCHNGQRIATCKGENSVERHSLGVGCDLGKSVTWLRL